MADWLAGAAFKRGVPKSRFDGFQNPPSVPLSKRGHQRQASPAHLVFIAVRDRQGSFIATLFPLEIMIYTCAGFAKILTSTYSNANVCDFNSTPFPSLSFALASVISAE
jgi:hypothetical protein